ncbi:Maf-like protein [Parabacteroides sp. PF5-9]|uniref:Maf-like protein n=1 Tax=Parabacteroides sp. PF5-9 TaxID=1742404 RepID=UPI0024748CB6|nr:Maf-like protein [Parabacteroides sp. PF5-9]MDH6357269.1 septum formation protein [Parabacteroides sp. PF5-9]
MLENLKKYKLVLGSNSPRRKELLKGLGLDFEVRVIADVDESYSPLLQPVDIPESIARKKADAYQTGLAVNELLITADTIVWSSEKVLGKPVDFEDAVCMLHELSGHVHQVITGVCLMAQERSLSFSVTSDVQFAQLTDEEIRYYVTHYKPYDKAGAYGIQEWIGYIGVEGITGSFYNVMGLPIQRLYQELKTFQ